MSIPTSSDTPRNGESNRPGLAQRIGAQLSAFLRSDENAQERVPVDEGLWIDAEASRLAAELVAEVAAPSQARGQIEVVDGAVVMQDTGVVLRSEQPDDVLAAFLELIQELRADDLEGVSTLRRIDIEVLAAHLAWPADQIIDRLGGLLESMAR